MTEEAQTKLELAVASGLLGIAFVRYVAASQRIAVHRDRRERQQRAERAWDAERARTVVRDEFREDVAAGVAEGVRDAQEDE